MKPTTQPVANPAAGGSYLLQPDGTLKRRIDGEPLVDLQPITPTPTQKTAPAGADQE